MEGTLSPPARAAARAQGAVAAALAGLPQPALRALAGGVVERDGQRLEPEVQLMLRFIALTGARHLQNCTVKQARRRVAANTVSVRGRRPEPVDASQIPITGGAHPLVGRLYAPAGVPAASGLLVYFHGGGFVVGDLDSHDHLCRLLALAAGVRVLAVEYRLAPEHPFPAAADDAWAALRFAADQAEMLGVDPGQIAVGGDSAGGNLAAGVALRAAGPGEPEVALQLLLYPWLDLSAKRPSYGLFGDGFYLTEGDLDWYRAHYLGATGDPRDEQCSPLRAAPSSRVAPAYIATAGFDPLRDEGEDYAARLQGASVPVVLRRHSGLIHGFANVLGVGRLGREAVLQAAGALSMGLAAARSARRRRDRSTLTTAGISSARWSTRPPRFPGRA